MQSLSTQYIKTSSAAAETRTLLAATPQRVRGRRSPAQRVQALAVPLVLAGHGSGNVQALSHLASAVGFALGALWVGNEMIKDQDRATEQDGGECPSCDGSGVVDCACNRWSDGDVGCSACHGSGEMVCNSCRGGGRARPITSNVYARGKRPE